MHLNLVRTISTVLSYILEKRKAGEAFHLLRLFFQEDNDHSPYKALS